MTTKLLERMNPILITWIFLSLLGVNPASATETVTYLHTDMAGSPIAATDSAGNVIWRENYRPYGERTKNQPASASNRQFFHDKPFDQDSGLSYFGARYYDPVVGRFMGVDPKGFDEKNLHSFNRYAYGNNNPYKYKDPDGRAAETVIDIISLGLSIAAFRSDPSLINGLGLAYDTFATAVPFLPAGFGIIKNAGRAADALGDAAKSGQTVLGKFPDYLKLADEIGAKRFNIPMDVWNKMTKAEQWAANQKFLDRMIARGDEIVLSNPVKDINNVSGAFRQELNYLIEKGFRLSEDGTRMIK